MSQRFFNSRTAVYNATFSKKEFAIPDVDALVEHHPQYLREPIIFRSSRGGPENTAIATYAIGKLADQGKLVELLREKDFVSRVASNSPELGKLLLRYLR